MSAMSPNVQLALKLVLIAVLTLVLWVPTLLILILVEERAGRQTEVREEIHASWGGVQHITGPILVVPTEVAATREQAGFVQDSDPVHQFILPATLDMRVEVLPEVRKRSIFETVVYGSTIRISGAFEPADLLEAGSTALRWDRAQVVIGLGDLRGLTQFPTMNWAGEELALEASARAEFFGASLAAGLPNFDPTAIDGSLPFEILLSLRGAESLDIVPVGGSTAVEVSSPWPDPSFQGAFLPDQREVSDDGFTASWRVLYLNRDFPQTWRGPRADDWHMREAFDNSAFGVRLLPGVDAYARTSRALKYSGIFTLLTLMAFFAVEHGGRERVHPIQYVAVGLGLCLFYLTLLALGEVVAFDLAFVAAAAVIVASIGAYARALFTGARSVGIVVGALGVVYTALFVMLRLEDFALLMGTGLLLVLLGVVMRLTRHLNRESAD